MAKAKASPAGPWPAGLTITSIRLMSDAEKREEGWSDARYPIPVLALSDGSILFSSRDEEGNGPGEIFGRKGSEALMVMVGTDGKIIGPEDVGTAPTHRFDQIAACEECGRAVVYCIDCDSWVHRTVGCGLNHVHDGPALVSIHLHPSQAETQDHEDR